MDRPARFRRSAYKIELKKKKESPASGSARLRRPTDRIELSARINATAQASTSNAFRAVMEEPGNVVTSTIRNIPRFDGIKPENYREWSSKTRIVLSMSDKDVFDVLNGSVEPVPATTDSDTPDTPTYLVEKFNAGSECARLSSAYFTLSLAALQLQFDNMKTGLRRGIWDTDRRRGTLCTPRKHGEPATRSKGKILITVPSS